MVSDIRSKIIRTANLYLMFFGVGLLLAVPGPTLLELEKNINADTYYTTFIYTARSSGHVLGSIIGGYLFGRFNKQTIILLCIFICGITNLFIPLFDNIFPLILTMAGSGVAMGAIDTGSNIWLLELWSEKSGPFMQALHFLFGLGAFAAPILANPFLPSEFTTTPNETSTNLTTSDNYRILDQLRLPKVAGCYVIISGYVFLVGISLLSVACGKSNTVEKKDKTVSPRPPFYYMLLPMFLLCLYTGSEMAYGQFLTTFCARSVLGLSAKVGSLITSLFWVSFTFFRCIGIALASKFSASSIIIFDLTLMNLAGIILTFFGDSSLTLLAIGTVLLGIAMSSVFPATYSWMETYMEVTSQVAACLVISGALGEMIVPLCVGYFVDTRPMYLMYIILICSVGCLITYFGILKVFSVLKSNNDDDNVKLKSWQNSSTEVLALSF